MNIMGTAIYQGNIRFDNGMIEISKPSMIVKENPLQLALNVLPGTFAIVDDIGGYRNRDLRHFQLHPDYTADIYDCMIEADYFTGNEARRPILVLKPYKYNNYMDDLNDINRGLNITVAGNVAGMKHTAWFNNYKIPVDKPKAIYQWADINIRAIEDSYPFKMTESDLAGETTMELEKLLYIIEGGVKSAYQFQILQLYYNFKIIEAHRASGGKANSLMLRNIVQ